MTLSSNPILKSQNQAHTEHFGRQQKTHFAHSGLNCSARLWQR